MALVQFCVNSYQSDSLPISAQRALNVYAEKEPPDTKTPVALFGVPGITNFVTCGDGPTRQVHVMNNVLYVVSGADLYSVTPGGVVTNLGSLAVSGSTGLSGTVVMEDNGYQLVILNNGKRWVYQTAVSARKAGGDLTESSNVPYLGSFVTELLVTAEAGATDLYVADITNFTSIRIGDPIIIDLDNGGQFRTTVVNWGSAHIILSGDGSNSTAAIGNTVNDATSAGANTFLSAAAPIGSTRFDVQSIINMVAGDKIQVQLDDNRNYTGDLQSKEYNHILIANPLPSNATLGNEVAVTAARLLQVIDPNSYPSRTVTYFDDYFVSDRADTNEFILSSIGDGTTYPPLYFASAQVNPDLVVGVITDHEILLVFGGKSIESWYDAGLQNFPFQRYDGATVERGTNSPYTILKEDNAVFFLGDDKVFYRLQGVLPIRVSTNPIEAVWKSYRVISDAFCFSYTIKGHKFLNLIFPSGPGTFIFDISTGLWHERESYNLSNKLLGRWRGNCGCYFNNNTVIGDFLSGKVGLVDLNTYTEFGANILGQATGAPIRSDRKRIFMSRFELEVESGVGQTGSQPNIITLTTNLPTQASSGNLIIDNTSGVVTSLSSAADRGATVIDVTSIMDIANNDSLSITLDDGTIFATKVASISSLSNPQIYLDYSDDGGHTFSTPQLPRSLGGHNQYFVRQRWLRLGQSRNRTMRVTINDPIKRVIVAAYADTFPGM